MRYAHNADGNGWIHRGQSHELVAVYGIDEISGIRWRLEHVNESKAQSDGTRTNASTRQDKPPRTAPNYLVRRQTRSTDVRIQLG